jgi:hypothetical protein
MNNIEKFALFAVLFLLGFLIINYSSCKSILESYGGGRGGGRGGIGRGGIGRGGIGRGWGGRGGYYGRGYYGRGYYGGYGYNPVYIYDDSNYGYSYPYWYRYIPFLNSYY